MEERREGGDRRREVREGMKEMGRDGKERAITLPSENPGYGPVWYNRNHKQCQEDTAMSAE